MEKAGPVFKPISYSSHQTRLGFQSLLGLYLLNDAGHSSVLGLWSGWLGQWIERPFLVHKY